MKNLRAVDEVRSQLALRLGGDEQLSVAAFDPESGRAFFASSANFIYCLELPHHKQGNGNLLLSEPLEVPLEHGDLIIALDYIIEKEALLVASSDGNLMLYSIETGTYEIVGRVDGGVCAIASSPDGTLLSITTGSGQLLVMTYEWEVLHEASLDPQLSYGEATLGDSEHSIFPIQSAVSWRGDGKFFATLTRSEDSSFLQKLIIWERDTGSVHASSQPKPFMGALVDWMPSGAKIATAYNLNTEGKCPAVALFEKNGLERSSFSISEPGDCTIKALKWNCNSDLLGMCISFPHYDSIKIWHCSNYHWYVKREIRYPKKEGVQFSWDLSKPLHLVCWTLTGKIIAYKVAWCSAVTETSLALAIDDSNVLVTPLSLSLMPPPMSLFKFKFQSAVNEIHSISSNSRNLFAALLSNGNLCVAELPEAKMLYQFEGSEIFVDSCCFELILDSFMHLTWLDADKFIGVACCSEKKHLGFSYSLLEIEVECQRSMVDTVHSSGWSAKIVNTTPLEASVLAITLNPAKRGSSFIQLSGGSVLEYTSGLPKPTLIKHPDERGLQYVFGFPCHWMKAIFCRDNGVARTLLFGLDDNGKLQIGKETLSNNCSSLAFYYGASEAADELVTHIILTTKQDMLFVINVSDVISGTVKLENAKHANSKGSPSKDHIVLWEKGAKIVGILNGDEAAVILQTNRGNLECIFPRRLVLVSILNALSQSRFSDAIGMVRRHRIDFNIIVDYCGWRAFLTLAAEFVSQVNNLAYITEFVSSIRNENITYKLYREYVELPIGSELLFESSGNTHLNSSENKVSSVLKAVRKALEEKLPESPSRELCILTTLARSEPPLLEEALDRIKHIRELEFLGADDLRRKLYPSAEESLRHILWLTDPEAVFNSALGLYDLNLAAIVALNSQKDPKEFLPFLKGLECLPPLVMRYTIDVRLQKYDSALKHIISAGDEYFEDSMKLMKSHAELFPLGLQLFTDQVKKNYILEAWGDHLFEEKCFTDAATTYMCCSLYQKALKAYRSCGDWRAVFTVSGAMKFDSKQTIELALELCEEFQAIGKAADAAQIALEYCSDIDRGVGYYIVAREWEEAIRVVYKHNREDLIVNLENAALESASNLVSEYEEGSLKVGKYLARYVAVRQRRLLVAAKVQSDERTSDVEDDTASEVSTSLSEMSAYTTRTSKGSTSSVVSSRVSKTRASRRQKKSGRIRAGSPGEEIALVEHLKDMALSASAQHELKNLLSALIILGKADIAQKLQHVVENFALHLRAAVRLCEDTISSDHIDENVQTLEHYVKMAEAIRNDEKFAWQIRALPPS